MTRIERIAPLLEALSDDAFEQLLSAASYAAGDVTIYDTLPDTEIRAIEAAVARLDAGEGVGWSEVKARMASALDPSGK